MSAAVTRLAVLGHPLRFTRSPELHRAGLEATGRACESRALPTTVEELPARLADLARAGTLGVNLTHPLKAVVLPLLTRVSAAARLARSVNTVGLAEEGWWGESTDGVGFVDLLLALGRSPAHQRVLLLGSGGAARSLALALLEAGAAEVTAATRDPERVREEWAGIPGAALARWRSADEADALSRATTVVNATPLTGDSSPLELDRIPRRTLVIDLVYGERPTDWTLAARAHGLEAFDGLGLLVFQARRAITLWLREPVPIDPLARAVGWPR